MKSLTLDPKISVELLNELYDLVRKNTASGTGKRVALVGLLNEIHEDVCDRKQAGCARCAEFGGT